MLRVAGFIYMKNNQISCSCQRLAHKTQAFHRDLLPCVGSHNFGKRKLNCCTCGYYRSRFSGKKPGLLAHIKHFKHLSPVSKALHWPPLNSRLFTGLYILGLIHPSFDNLYSLHAWHDLRSAETGFLWFITCISRQRMWL